MRGGTLDAAAWVEREREGGAVRTMASELVEELPHPWTYAFTCDGRIFFIK